jgi:hypothetical protein
LHATGKPSTSKLCFWSANYVGTHFGGSLFAMTDAFYMLMLMANLLMVNLLMVNLGRDYLVWDKAANLAYPKPGKGTVRAECCLTEARLDDIREKLKTLPKCEPMFPVEVKDEAGVVIAEVEKLGACAKSRMSRRASRQAAEQRDQWPALSLPKGPKPWGSKKMVNQAQKGRKK